jgi:uncharacterized protein
MIPRIISLSNDYSFFLLGPRGAGKSSLLRSLWSGGEGVVWIDLLLANEEAIFQKNPDELILRTEHLKEKSRVIIDEVQKVPRLLDVVHKLIEEKKLLFALSGSSARKLKRGAANLLAGRAFVYNLQPFSFFEISSKFDLFEALRFGMLPKIFEFDSFEDKKMFLQAYANTYIREEIQMEQIVRNLPGFRRFLEVASQMNGQPLNYSKIGRYIKLDHSVIRNFYEVLEDTLLGFFLPAYEPSIRKQQIKSAKFYFFDTGIVRALNKMLDLPIRPNTYEFGRAFEHFIIIEIYKLCTYKNKNESLYHFRTKDGFEVDLIITRPGKADLFIEIKSSSHILKEDISSFVKQSKSLNNAQAIVLSLDKNRKTFNSVESYYWETFLDLFYNDKI